MDGELDSHAETLPVAGRLGDVFTDLLGGLLWVSIVFIPGLLHMTMCGASPDAQNRSRRCRGNPNPVLAPVTVQLSGRRPPTAQRVSVSTAR